jgi:hypothetical protein
MYSEHSRFPSLHALDVFYVWPMSASTRSDSGSYPVPLDEPWTGFGRDLDVNGTIEMHFKRLLYE